MTDRLAARFAAGWRTLLTSLDDDSGDVPGWVLVTLMTAGLVVALWAVADDALQAVFKDAISRVSNTK